MAQNDNLQTLQPSEPGAEHKRLEVFIGKWIAEGVNMEGSPIPGSKITEVESYEWQTGEFFLLHRGELRPADLEPFNYLQVIGYDVSSQTYPVYYFDSQNNFRKSEVTVYDNTWTFTGEYERASFVFSDDGSTITQHWEISRDGSNWLPLCEKTATKVK